MATITVTTANDEGFGAGTFEKEANDGDGLSMREAIGLAVAGDTIDFDLGDSTTIRLDRALGQILITKDVTIDGGGVITITGDADGDDTTDDRGVTDVDASEGV